MRELILGGARSGKSTLALQRAHDSGKPVIFVATAQATDTEMLSRIAMHRRERPAHWKTVEVTTALAHHLQQLDDASACIVVDCLTLWLSNVLCSRTSDKPAFNDNDWQVESTALIDALSNVKADIVLVSNEVGLGIVPDNAVARRFRDEQGRLNQRIVHVCDMVTLVVAGIAVPVKAAPVKSVWQR